MEERSFAVPPPLPSLASKAKPRWLWFRIIAGALGGLLLLGGLFGAFTSPTLDVRIHRSGSVGVTNTGEHPITIKAAIINTRKDCDVVGGGFVPGKSGFHPQTLKVGESTMITSFSCNIVRITLDTDQGESTYTFKR